MENVIFDQFIHTAIDMYETQENYKALESN